MNRFNLTFRGEIIEGHDPEQVRTRLAELLAIDDPAQVQRWFSGDPVVLGRNMERKEAGALFARLRELGAQAELVKIPERGGLQSGTTVKSPAAAPDKGTTPPQAKPARNAMTSPPPLRRADLAAEKSLRAEDRAELKAREKALRKALKAKKKNEVKRGTGAGAPALVADRQAAAQAERERLEAAQRLRSRTEREDEERARLQAAREEKARLEAQERARIEAERVEKARQDAEERARLKAAREEKERLLAQERARLEAERAEKARKDAEERARVKAARAEKERLQREERARLAAEKAARREQEKRKVEQLAASVQVENARRKRQQAEEASRRKAEEARKKARELAQQKAEQEEQLAQRRQMEEQAINRAATELAQKPGLKPVDARVKTRLETPHRHSTGAPEGRRKRQPGAPNLYKLRPFRNTPEIRARAGQSHRIMRLAFTGGAIALVAALALGARVFTLAAPAILTGASAIAIAPQQGPLLLAGEHLLLHDRAGLGVADISLDALGLRSLSPPLAFDADGRLLAPGRQAGASADDGPAPLLRCSLDQPRCEIFSTALAGTAISALAVHPLDGSVFIADSSAGELLKLSAEGALLARAASTVPPAPVLRLDSGLLMMNSALGPAISVFRYEDEAFGKQLDEVLLLPPAPGSGEFTGVRDFLWSGEHWWVLLEQADSDTAGLYRFDPQWQFIDRPALAPNTRPAGLANWGSRTLVGDPSQLTVQRFNGAGMAEAPLVSGALAELVASQAHRANLTLLGWRLALALSVLAALAGVCLGALHRVRSLVYKSCREQGAEPIDKLADSIDWIEAAPDHANSLARTGIACAILATGLVLGAIGLGVSSLQLSALLLALTGPAAALLLLQRSDPEHIGISGSELLLVDHSGMYHLGGGARIHFRGPFLMIDDVIVFTGARLLPVFSRAGLEQRVHPLAAEGVRVDRKIVTVKLLQSRHPLALGAVAVLAAFAAAAALLSLQGIF